MFADTLERDVKILEEIADSTTADDERINLSFQLSLASKFAPSLGGTHDRKTNISSAIAALLGERGALHLQYAPPTPRYVIPVEQMHNLRIAYTRWVISPLRRFMQIPELYMSSKRWNQLPYQRVPSTCMQKNKKLFIKHDKARFSTFVSTSVRLSQTDAVFQILARRCVGQTNDQRRNASAPYTSYGGYGCLQRIFRFRQS